MAPSLSSVDPHLLIGRVYPPGHPARDRLLRHGERVARMALAVLDRADGLTADREFVVEAAYLHDIGIDRTHCPQLGCEGPLPYVCHGVEGRMILDQWGLPRHGLVCERHVGVGLSAGRIQRHGLPLPVRDMLPLSVEEQLICYADKFYSKTDDGCGAKSIDAILAGLIRYDPGDARRFMALHRRFDGMTRHRAGLTP